MCQDELLYFQHQGFSKIGVNISSAFLERHHLNHNRKRIDRNVI